MADEPIRVMIVDDHDVVRRGLTMLMQVYDDFELVGEAANGVDAVTMCASLQPDVILMDLIMPKMNGIEATKAIRANHPAVKIIALSSAKDEGLLQGVLEAGAIAIVAKDVSIDVLSKTIREANSQPVA